MTKKEATLYDLIYATLVPLPVTSNKITGTHVGESFWAFNSTYTLYSSNDLFELNITTLIDDYLRGTKIAQYPEFYKHSLTCEAAVGESYYDVVLVPAVKVANKVFKSALDAYVKTELGKPGSFTVKGKIAMLLRRAEYTITVTSQQRMEELDSHSIMDHTIALVPTVRVDREGKVDMKNKIASPKTSNYVRGPTFRKELANIMRKFPRKKAALEAAFRTFFKNEANSASDNNGDPTRNLPRIALLVIEEKKPGTLKADIWRGADKFVGLSILRGQTVMRNLRKIAPQIRKYSFDTKTPWAIITEFNEAVILNIRDTGIEEDRDVNVALAATREMTLKMYRPGEIRIHWKDLPPRAMVIHCLFHRLFQTDILDPERPLM